MASAGGGEGDGGQRVQHHITLRTSQGITLRFIQRPPTAGQPNAPHPNVRFVSLRPMRPSASLPGDGGGTFRGARNNGDIARAVQEQQAAARQRAEEEHRRAELRQHLTLPHPPSVCYHDDGTASLSWHPVSLEGEEVEYIVCMAEGGKETAVYSGSLTTCVVMDDLLNPGRSYRFQVSASVDGMKGTPSPACPLTLPALPPEKPLPPKMALRTKNGLVLKWNAPADNGSSINLYSVEWDQCGSEYVEVFSGKTKQFKFSHKFQPGAVAHFRLRAQNALGWSECSDPLEFSAGAGPPSTPSPPTLTHASAQTLTLHWHPPQDNGSPITSYRLEVDDPAAGYGFCPVYTGDETVFTCHSLARVTGYTFRLLATNERGTGPFSRPVTFQTLPDVPGPPGPPYLADRARPASLHLAWQPPTDNGGTPIHSYVLQMDRALGGLMTDSYQGPDTTYIAQNLLPGRTFGCRVCAVSEGGQGRWSRSAQFSTPATLPSPPMALRTAGKTTQMSAVLEWDRPQFDGGSPITSYSLELREGGKERWRPFGTVADPLAFTPSPSPLPPLTNTITRLTPGREYWFRVCCRNSIGESGWSDECECVTAPGAPDPPTALQVTSLAPSSLHLEWKPAVERGSPVVGYHLEFWVPGKERTLHSTSLTPLFVTTILPVRQYHARVKAISAAGHSDWSPPLTITTPPSIPSPPTHLHIVTRSPTTLHVAWAIPESHGAPITAYHIEASPGHVTSSLDHVTSVPTSETQCTVENLHPKTTYRLRAQAENDVGRGPFSSYITSSTLAPPPPPPLLSLTSCTAHTLRVTWGKKPVKGIEFILQLAQQGRRFHVVYRGADTTYRITRLQPSSSCFLRIAACSESGQGEWSDEITLATTPSPPHSPTGVLLQQVGAQVVASWQRVSFPIPVTYEAQVRLLPSRDYRQLYRGSDVGCTFPLPTPCPSNPYELRVRCQAVCLVNGREEMVWSSYCAPVQCLCLCRIEEEEEEEGSQMLAQHGEGRGGGVARPQLLSPRLTSLLVLVLASILTLILAFLLGQYAT